MLVREGGSKDGEGSAQTPETDPHLMQELGSARACCGLVGEDLPEAIVSNDAERLPCGECRRNVDLCGLLGLAGVVMQKLVTPFCLALHPKDKRPPYRQKRGRG